MDYTGLSLSGERPVFNFRLPFTAPPWGLRRNCWLMLESPRAKRQNGKVMASSFQNLPLSYLLAAALLAAGVTACGDGEKTQTKGTSGAFLSLDDETPPSAVDPSGESAEEAGRVNADEASLTEGQGKPMEASGGATSDGVRALDTWMRGLPEERTHLAAFSPRAAHALKDFHQIWEQGAARYTSQLKQELNGGGFSPAALGSEFESYAQAYASGGRSSLNQALARGTVGSMAWLAWTEASVRLDLDQDAFESAGRGLARLVDHFLSAGFDRLRIAALAEDVDLVGRHAREFLPSREYKVQSGDSYDRICRSFRKQGLHCYIGWLADFNHKRNYNLRAEETLLVPESKLKLKAWRGARLMLLEADGIPIRLYEVSMGRSDEPTPLGDFTLETCLKDPVWYRPNASPVPAGNPDNPLGKRWLGFAEDQQYGFHGTNSEDTIGGYESGGCVRMHNADVIELFELVGPGVPVTLYP